MYQVGEGLGVTVWQGSVLLSTSGHQVGTGVTHIHVPGSRTKLQCQAGPWHLVTEGLSEQPPWSLGLCVCRCIRSSHGEADGVRSILQGLCGAGLKIGEKSLITEEGSGV